MHGAVITWRLPFFGASLIGIIAMGTVPVRAEEETSLSADQSETSSVDSTVEDSDEPSHHYNYFSLDELSGYLEFESTYDHNRVQVGGRSPFRRGFNQTNRSTHFGEKLGINLGGSILDPEILSYTAQFTFGLDQDRFKESNRLDSKTDSDRGQLLEYDLRLDLFQGRRLSGSVYTFDQSDRIPRQFQPTLQEDRRGFGTSWFYAHDTLPMELSYDYSTTDRTGNRRNSDDEHFTESTLHYGLQWIISAYQQLHFSYEFADTKQEYQGKGVPFETRRHLFSIDHELHFGDQHQHELRTLIHWQEESGDFARDFFEFGPQLTLHHSDSLETLYKYQYNRERFEGVDVETQRVDFQLIHQMYTNLTSTFDLFALFEDAEDDLNTTQYGSSVDWQYNRKNRWGHFYANLAVAFDTEETRGDNGARLVIHESGTFHDPLPVILRNRDVLRFLILVTDAGGKRVFIEGVDYLVLQTRHVTWLVRVPTGHIPDNTTVLINYRYRADNRHEIDTLRVDFNAEQQFTNGITPYYRLSYRNQEDDFTSFFAPRADRTNHHRLGIKYEQARYNLSAELELFDDTVEPFDAFHLDGIWHIYQTPEHTFDALARFSRFFFEGGIDRRNANILNAEINHRWHLGDSISTVERLSFRWEDDSVDGITRAWDATAGVDYTLGDFSAELTMEYNRLDLPDSIEDDVGIYFRVRRDIPNVLAKR